MSKVIITGITGQTASYMAEYLLERDHEVYGTFRRSIKPNFSFIDHFQRKPNFHLEEMDVIDPYSVSGVVEKIKPDYFANFASNSFVGKSWEQPVNHMLTNCMGVLYQLEAIKKYVPECRFWNAGSSEEFGNVSYSPQDENHPIKPRSPYGASKASARFLVKVYRESYSLYAIQGWCYNHESFRRGQEFVTQKIAREASRIALEKKRGVDITPMELGNLDAKRDWSHARDFVDGIWRMLNQSSPKEYILASGETHSIREFVVEAFNNLGIEGVWWNPTGNDLDEEYILAEKGLATKSKVTLVKVNRDYFRPAEVELLLGDPSEAKKELGWNPRVSFKELVREMVDYQLQCQKNH